MSSLATSSSVFAKGAVKQDTRTGKHNAKHAKKASSVVARASSGDGKADEQSDFLANPELRQKLVSGVAAASLLANVAVVPVALAADAIALRSSSTLSASASAFANAAKTFSSVASLS